MLGNGFLPSKKALLFRLCLIVFLVVFAPHTFAAEQGELSSEAVPGQLIVKYKNHATPYIKSSIGLPSQQLRGSSVAFTPITIDYVLPEVGVALVNFDTGLSLEMVAETLRQSSDIEYVEPNYWRYPSSLDVNDSLAGLLW